jgi:hypothetical protein
LYLPAQQRSATHRVSSRIQRGSVAVVSLGLIATLAGCGAQYRPVVSAINPVGPAGQPTKYAIAVSSPSSTSLGLVTSIDFSGDTILSTPQILANPSYFVLNSSGQQGYVINAQGSLNTFGLANPAGLITSQVVQTTLPADSLPVSLTTLTPASEVGTIFIPQQATNSIAALNSSTAALYDDISVGNGGSNPVYVVGANGTTRVYAISQNAAGSAGQVDALEATSTLQLSISKTIPVGVKPVYGVMTADDRRAFILNQGSGTVSVLNVPSNALDTPTPTITIPQIPITGGGTSAPNPVWADLAPTISDLVVLNQGDGTHSGSLSIIQIPLCNAIAQPTNPNCDASNPVDAVGFGQIVNTAIVGIKPTMVSVLQDPTTGNIRAYVINSLDSTGTCAAGEGSVSVVNLATGQVSATICGISGSAEAADAASETNVPLIFGHPNSVSATSGTPTGKVYVTAADSNYASIIYTDSDTVQGHINLQGTGLRILVTQQ